MRKPTATEPAPPAPDSIAVRPALSRARLFASLLMAAIKNPGKILRAATPGNFRKLIAQLSTPPSVLEEKIKRKLNIHALAGGVELPMSFDEEAAFKDVAALRPRRQDAAPAVLVVDRKAPAFDRDSGSLRMYELLRMLKALGYAVTLLPMSLDAGQEGYAGLIAREGIEVLPVDVDREHFLRHRGAGFSHVILSRPHEAHAMLPLVRAYAIHARVLYDTVDLHWVRFERGYELTGDEAQLHEARAIKPIELALAASADACITVTQDERETLTRELPGLRVEVLPNVHEPAPAPPAPYAARHGLMFIGNYKHAPNEDAVRYFIKEIWPIIEARMPGMEFHALGSDPTHEMRALRSSSVHVPGFVPDVAPYFERCRVFVCPLRYGAGMKGKVGQSMTHGLPVVTTSIGAEGIGLVHGETALVADNPSEFASQVIRLYEDEALWHKLSANSLSYVHERYGREAVSKRLRAALEARA